MLLSRVKSLILKPARSVDERHGKIQWTQIVGSRNAKIIEIVGSTMVMFLLMNRSYMKRDTA